MLVKMMPVMAIRRGPRRSIITPVTGASRPCSKLRSETPSEIAATLQPSSKRIESMNTPKLKVTRPMTRKFVHAPAATMYQP